MFNGYRRGDYYLQNVWVALAGYILGLFLALLRVITFYNNRNKRKLLRYRTRTIKIIEESHKVDGLNITFKGKQIFNLTITKLLVYNSGSLAIKETDVPSKSSIEIRCTEKILHAKVSVTNEDTNLLQIKTTGQEEAIDLSFSYIGHNDGAIITIFHEKPDATVSVFGKLIDGKIKAETSSFEASPQQASKVSIVLAIVLFTVLAVGICFDMRLFFITCLASLVNMYYLTALSKIKATSLDVPRGLESYNDDSTLDNYPF